MLVLRQANGFEIEGSTYKDGRFRFNYLLLVIIVDDETKRMLTVRYLYSVSSPLLTFALF